MHAGLFSFATGRRPVRLHMRALCVEVCDPKNAALVPRLQEQEKFAFRSTPRQFNACRYAFLLNMNEAERVDANCGNKKRIKTRAFDSIVNGFQGNVSQHTILGWQLVRDVVGPPEVKCEPEVL